jgi:hypothetical protein
VQPQPPLHRIEERLQREEEEQIQNAELGDPRVQHVDPHGLAVLPLLDGPQCFERTQHGVHRKHLEHADDHPVQAVVGVFVVVHQAEVKQRRLHDALVQRGLQRRDRAIECGENQMEHGLAVPRISRAARVPRRV